MGLYDIHFKWPVVVSTALALLVSKLIWRRYFTSISDVPGPFLASFTRLWHIVRIAKGKQNFDIIKLHDELGMPMHRNIS